MKERLIRIVRAGGDATLRFASSELKKYLKMAESNLTVDEMIGSGDEWGLVLRVSEALAEKLAVRDPALDDGFRIDVQNGVGVIEGTNPRSVLFGVYRFLKELGFAFTRPGTDGERIPSALPEEYAVSVSEKAAYRHRGVTIEGANSYQNVLDMIDYLPKCNLNEYFIQFFVPGTFFERWYRHEQNPYYEKQPFDRETVAGFSASLEEEIKLRGLGLHKTGHGWTCEPFGIDGTAWDPKREYPVSEENRRFLAQVNGKRELWGNIPLNTNLCYSNGAVRERITDAILDMAKQNPHIDALHFWLADDLNNQCECEACRKMRPADWYVKMLNEADEKLTKADLPTKIVFLLYVDLLWEPEKETIQNPDRFILMFAPITRDYGVNYADSPEFGGELSPYVRNRLSMPADLSENLARLAKWQERFHGDSFIFDYHLMWPYVADPGARWSAINIFEDMKDLKRLGLDGSVSCQVQRVFFPSGLAFYAMSEALWNDQCGFDAVERAYYRAVYGAAGDRVRDYLRLISECFTLYPYYKKARRPDDLPFVLDEERLLACIEAMQPVILRGITEGGQAREDFKNLRLHAEFVRELLALLNAPEEEKDAAIETMCDWINRHEPNLQSVLDGDNCVKLLKRRMQGSF